jgi:hypothetical protein
MSSQLAGSSPLASADRQSAQRVAQTIGVNRPTVWRVAIKSGSRHQG